MDHILTDEELDRLQTCPVFRGCSPDLVRRALTHPECSVHCFLSGQTLYRPDRFSRCLGVLLSGGVRVTRDALAISILAPGDLFGAAALFNDRPDYATTLTAISPCRVILLSQELVSLLMDESPVIRDNYIRYLSDRIRFLSGKIRSLAADSAEGKLKQYLLTSLSPDCPRLDCPATELARRLGISRASLYRAFEALEGQALIRRKGRSILVPDLKELESSEF
ncbi:MAG: Crp/Fnr family transcriptional regulator [Ruminococcaceae bacterium]|nr:Crp/Fnr family transcriptional regulator [Oscillospiraceae bacterium]